MCYADFLEKYQHETPASRQGLIVDELAPTGLPEWDALLARLAEHLADLEGISPARVEDRLRFLTEPWCYFDLRTALAPQPRRSRVADAAWSLPHPLPEGIAAAEHVGFYPEKVTVSVDDAQLE